MFNKYILHGIFNKYKPWWNQGPNMEAYFKSHHSTGSDKF